MWMVLKEKIRVEPRGVGIITGWEIFCICDTQAKAEVFAQVAREGCFREVKIVEIPEYDLGL